MNILSCDQFTKDDINKLFSLADLLDQHYLQYKHVLNDKIIAVLFYESSTRTRLSFESAVQRLGGKVISTENAKEVSSAVKGESLSDTIRVISGYCDAIILRHFDVDSAEVAARVSSVPIINAGSGMGEHPTQALLDLYTINKKKNTLNGLKIAVVGDLFHGRTVHSLAKLFAKYENNTVYGLSHEALGLPQEYIDILTKNNHYIPLHTLDALPKDLDVIYQTRNQVERFSALGPSSEFPEFTIHNAFLNTFHPDLILMHPLPRNTEISPDCDENVRSYYFKQAHAGIPVRMALLVSIFS